MGYAHDYVQMYAWPKSNADKEHKFEIQGRLNKKRKMEYTDTKVEDLFNLGANVDYPIPYLHILTKSSQTKNFTDENIMAMGERLQEWGYRGRITLFCYLDDAYYEKRTMKIKERV